MDPVTISALIGAATTAIQGIAGGSQLNKAAQLEKQYPRPTATTSESIKDLKGYAYSRMLDQDIPGGEIYRNEIKNATASGIMAASKLGKGSEAYGMLDRLVLGQQQNFSKLAAEASGQRYAAEGDYMQVLQGPVYQEERRVDYWNKEMPYLQAATAAQALRQSGSQNLMSSAKNTGGIFSALLDPKTNKTGVELSNEELQAILGKIIGTQSGG